jgi:lipoprotein-releasing system permease protein
MMDFFSSFVALRYIKANRKNLFFSWIAALSVLGVTISVCAMIVVLSVISGFEVELRRRFLHANAHVLLFRFPGGIKDHQDVASIVRRDFGRQITGISPFVHYETMIRYKGIMNGVLIRGIAPKERETVQSIRKVVRPDTALDILQQEIEDSSAGRPLPSQPAIILGTGLLKILNASVGDTVQVVAPNSGQSSTEFGSFKVVGVYDSGLKHYDNKLAALSIPAAQKFFGLGDKVIGLEIGLVNPDNSPDVAAEMEQKYNYSVREWQSFNQPLFKAMENEKVIIGLIVWLIAIVAGFNILMTILVAVTQKQREISILKALGASNRQVMTLFLKQGFYIGIVGSIFGVISAYALARFIQRYLHKIIELPDPYFLDVLPVDYSLSTYLLVPLAALVLCIVSGIYPSLIAARVSPTEGIRGSGRGAV